MLVACVLRACQSTVQDLCSWWVEAESGPWCEATRQYRVSIRASRSIIAASRMRGVRGAGSIVGGKKRVLISWRNMVGDLDMWKIRPGMGGRGVRVEAALELLLDGAFCESVGVLASGLTKV